MSTERLTAANFLKSKGIKDTLYNENKWVKGGLSDLLEAFARQEVEPIEKQRDELLEMMNSLMLSIAAHPDYVNGDEDDEWHTLLSLAETAIKNAEK